MLFTDCNYVSIGVYLQNLQNEAVLQQVKTEENIEFFYLKTKQSIEIIFFCLLGLILLFKKNNVPN